MNRYPSYRDSGIDWVGDIPGHWDVLKLKYAARLTNEEPGDEQVGFQIALENIESKTGRYLRTGSEYEGAGCGFRTGDVLFNKLRPYLSKVYEAPRDGVSVGELLVLRLERNVDSRFLFYRLLSEDFISVVDGSTYGAKMPRANWDFVGGLGIPIPPLDEQRRLAAYLDRKTGEIDTLIRKKQALIALLREQRTALIHRAVTKGLDPATPMKDSGFEWIGGIPRHWSAPKIKFMARVESGHTPSRKHPEYWEDCHLPWFTLGDVWQIRDERTTTVSQTKEMVSEVGLAHSSARLLPAGTVILSRTASVGFSGVLGVDMATSQDFVCWIAGPAIRPMFLLYVLRAMKGEFRRLLMGSTHKTIYMPDAYELVTPLPPVEEQDEIVARVERDARRIDGIIDREMRSVDLLGELRASLISEVVTGKIDVRSQMPAPDAYVQVVAA